MTAVLVLFVTLLDGTQPQPVVLTEPMPQHMCLALSQPMAAKWMGDHPKHKLVGMACADPRKLQVFLGRRSA
jgi:hypothetical protein